VATVNSDPIDLGALRHAAEGKLGIVHRDGIPWYQAPLPRRFHRCEAQTYGLRMGVLRCACGGIASTFGPWMEKNSRRRRQRRP
jgi:hypothetical protein